VSLDHLKAEAAGGTSEEKIGPLNPPVSVPLAFQVWLRFGEAAGRTGGGDARNHSWTHSEVSKTVQNKLRIRLWISPFPHKRLAISRSVNSGQRTI
jgi:hypothetical protein